MNSFLHTARRTLFQAFCTTFIVASSLLTLHAQQNGAEQALDLIVTENGTKFIRWHAKTAHTYFIQISDPADHLGKWNYATIIESGHDQEISHEVNATAEKGFFRLHYTDQAIPLGETVETADFDGDGLTNSQEIEVFLPLVGTNPLKYDTDGDGMSDGFERTFGFDPNDANPSDSSAGPSGDPDGDGLTNLVEAGLGTNPNNPNTDGDTFNDDQDADPRDPLIDWPAAPESSYVMIEVELPTGTENIGGPQDLNDKSEVLFETGIWSGDSVTRLTPPDLTGIVPRVENDNGETSYHSEIQRWSSFNNGRQLVGHSLLDFTFEPDPGSTNSSGSVGQFYSAASWLHIDQPQYSEELADKIPFTLFPKIIGINPLGITALGTRVVNISYLEDIDPDPEVNIFKDRSRLIVFDANGSGPIVITPPDESWLKDSSYPNTKVSPSGWIVSQTEKKDASGNHQYGTALWNPQQVQVPLPSQANGYHYRVYLSEITGTKPVLVTVSGESADGSVFLSNSQGQMEFVPSLSSHHLQTFAGDGTAMSSDGKLWRNGKLIPMRELCPKFGELLDQGYQLFPLKGNKHGVYLIQAEGSSGEQKVFVASPIEIRGYATKQSEQVDSFIGSMNNQNVYEAHRVKIADSSDCTTLKTETKTKLKIAQWGAFDIFDDNLNFVHEQFKEDLDIFRVRLPDFPIPTGSVEHRIKISTKDKTGAVLDSGAEVDLNIVREDPADPNSPIKFHETAALALVPNDDDDDDFAVEGKQDSALGDRTYRAVLGGTVKVEWLTAPGNGPKPFIVIPVPAERVVTIQGFLLKGTTTNATVQGWYDCAKKIYSADGVDLIFKDLIPIDPLPAGVDLDEFDLPTETAGHLQQMQPETIALMDDHRCVVPQDTIPVFFVKKLNPDVAKGATNVPSYMVDGEEKYAGAIFINSDHQLKSVLAHELAHALLDAQHAPSTNKLWNDIFSDTREKTNIWWGDISYANGTWSEAGIDAHRRLTDSMRSRIWKSRFAKIPPP